MTSAAAPVLIVKPGVWHRAQAAWACHRANAVQVVELENEGVRYAVLLNHWLPVLLGHEACTLPAWFSHGLEAFIRVAGPVLAAQTRRHEFTHVKQIVRKGKVAFVGMYSIDECEHGYPSAADGYRSGNALEVEAYQDELAFVQHATPDDLAAFTDVVAPAAAQVMRAA